MPTLEWIGKSKVINHHQEVPFRVLEEKYTYNNSASENKIIHGDNLEALKALLPEYEGRINCIYIDPPYNTGEEKWVYNDNVNDPKIKNWLGKVVGDEEKDLTRHDKWLCMMYPRLRLLHQLLAEDGVIFINIDDNEQAHLRVICDEIFGAVNFLAAIAWEKRYTRSNNAKLFYSLKDTILCYRKSPLLATIKEERTEKADSNYSNPDNDPRGPWSTSSYVNPATKSARPNLVYTIIGPDGREVNHPTHAWKYQYSEHLQHIKENRLWWGNTGDAIFPRLKIYKNEMPSMVPVDLWNYKDTGTTDDGGNTLKEIFGSMTFDTPKPVSLIERIIKMIPDQNALFLDSFAGSGTTAHAVLDLNKKDGGKRKFILIEMEEYADSITAERVKRVIDGYQSQKETNKILYDKKITLTNLKKGVEKLIQKAEDKAESEAGNYDKISGPDFVEGHLRVTGTKFASENIEGTGGDFTYYELGEPLLKADQTLNEEVPVEKIQHYIWHTETHTPYNKPENENPAYLGEHNYTAYYFHYKKDELTTLDYDFLAGVNIKADNYVIYADTCILSQEELLAYNITFKKIPRDITKI